jgi:glycosyltransferase involved in cell wall biosynthesis
MNKSNVKINILSPGRFHVCDLARELDKNGFDVKFYSFVPTRRAVKFGLPKHCSKSVIGIMAPFLLLERTVFNHSKWPRVLRVIVQDYITGIYMRRCDICIAMSGSFLFSIKRAKKQGSIVILERGSKHILEQKKILDHIKEIQPQANTVPDINVKREMKGYQIADYIAIPSEHVKLSFENHHYPLDKLFINPYGVDVSMFYPQKNSRKKFDLIMVGGWSLRKGCDLIIKAVSKLNLKLIHVGSIVDFPFPQSPNFVHIAPVNQSKLIDYYNMAKVFILPSREEGLAMVQVQAIACNLPIVGSPDSGAVDLKKNVEYPKYITIINDYSVNAVCTAIEKSLSYYKDTEEIQYAGSTIQNMTWEAYGRRYAQFLNTIIELNGI